MKAVLMLQLWNPPPRFHTLSFPRPFSISASSSTTQQQDLLTGKERRHLRNERRESNNTTNWREEIEEKIIKKTKKKEIKPLRLKDEVNLDNLIKLGPQWWTLRVARGMDQYTAEALGRSFEKLFPDKDFKVYAPVIDLKRKMKNGSISVKSKPVFAGSIFLRCELNKTLHDFIKKYDGVSGFLGNDVGYAKNMINKPKPVGEDNMETIFRQAKMEQEKADKAFEEEQKISAEISANRNSENKSDVSKAIVDSKPKRGSRKTSNQLAVTKEASSAKKAVKLTKGSTVQIISGSFSGFTGILKKLSHKTKMATVHLTVFGKENIVDLDVSEISLETT